MNQSIPWVCHLGKGGCAVRACFYPRLLYSQIERLTFGRAYVFIQSQHQYLSFRKTREIQSLFIFVRRCCDCVYSIAWHRNCQSSKCCACVWFWAPNKSHSVLFGSGNDNDNALGFSVGNSAGRFIWFLVVCVCVLPPRVNVMVLFQNQSGWEGRILYVYVVVVVTIVLTVGVFIHPQSIFIDFLLYFTANFICKRTKLDGFVSAHLYLHPHANIRTRCSNTYMYWFAAAVCTTLSARRTLHFFFVCLFVFPVPFLFSFTILILCWFFQGKSDKSYPIVIIMALCTLGVVCGVFLPETLHQKLPDSMQEAREFGANQVTFSLCFSFHLIWLSRFLFKFILIKSMFIVAEILEFSKTAKEQRGWGKERSCNDRWTGETSTSVMNLL